MAALGAVLLAGWVTVELRSTHPMIELRIFANARFSAASFAVTMIFFALFGWLFLFTQQMQFVLGYPFLLTASVIIAAGMGLAMAPATESIMGALPRSQAGAGSAVNDTTRNLGGALGVAILGSLASSAFAAQLRPVLAHIPALPASQAPASVGAAVTAGQHTAGPVGYHLIEAARQAFVIGADHALIAAAPAPAAPAPAAEPVTLETVIETIPVNTAKAA